MPGRPEGRKQQQQEQGIEGTREKGERTTSKATRTEQDLRLLLKGWSLENERRIGDGIEWLLLASIVQKQPWGRTLALKVMMIPSTSVQFIGKGSPLDCL